MSSDTYQSASWDNYDLNTTSPVFLTYPVSFVPLLLITDEAMANSILSAAKTELRELANAISFQKELDEEGVLQKLNEMMTVTKVITHTLFSLAMIAQQADQEED